MDGRILRSLAVALGAVAVTVALPLAIATAEPSPDPDDTVAPVAAAPPEIGTPVRDRAAAHPGKVCVPQIGFLGDMHCLWK